MATIMKKDIHPKYYAEAKVICACGHVFTTGSTLPEIKPSSVRSAIRSIPGTETGRHGAPDRKIRGQSRGEKRGSARSQRKEGKARGAGGGQSQGGDKGSEAESGKGRQNENETDRQKITVLKTAVLARLTPLEHSCFYISRH
jgi:hypothetical protein